MPSTATCGANGERMKPARGRSRRVEGEAGQEARGPMPARRVLLLAILLPGMGQVANQTPDRGLMFAFFTLLLGWVTFHLTTPEHSFLGRYAGGICIYLVSVYDAWRIARLREARFRDAGPSEGR